MKSVVLKSIALVAILAFVFMLVPQQAEADDCADAQLACSIARIIAGWVCGAVPPLCGAANDAANAVCSWAADVCG